MTTDEYLELITHAHRQAPRYMASVRACIEPLADLQAKLRQFVRDFDVDEAVGVQLDTIGRWVGFGREIELPVNDYFFTWGGTVTTGWDSGAWEGYGDRRSRRYLLPDDLYRQLIKAKILLNRWQGSKGALSEAYRIFAEALNRDGMVLIVDGALYRALFILVFTWDDPARGWDVAEWAEESPYPLFSWDTLHHGWDESVRGMPREEEGGDDPMTVWVCLRGNVFSEVLERIILSGVVPFNLAGVQVNYMVF